MNLTDIFTARAIAANWTETASNRIPYLGSALFPAKKKAGLDLAWIKGNNGLPVSLKPSAFDAKATFRDRIAVTKIETEMPFFREAFLIKEKDRQEIMRVRDSNDPYASAVLANIFNDAQNLIEGANVVPERMIMQLLAPSNGKPGINITANGVAYAYDYDPLDKFKTDNFLEIVSENDKWNNTETSDPLSDLREAASKIEDITGNRPSLAIMSRKTANYLLQNKKVQSAILAQNPTANIFMTDNVLLNAILQILGITVVIYSKKYKDESGIVHQFYPDNMVTLVPNGNLGNTWYGTTPEEADLMSQVTRASVSIVNTGVAITTLLKEHPVNVETIASEIVLPSFERMDEVAVLKVV